MATIRIQSKEEIYNRDLHHIRSFRITDKEDSLLSLLKMHGEFYGHLGDVCSYLSIKYGKVWCPKDHRSLEDLSATASFNKDELIKDLVFLAENLDRQYGPIFDEGTGLLRVYCGIRTKEGHMIIREIHFDINPTILIPFIIKSSSGGYRALTIEKYEYWGMIIQDEKVEARFGIDKLLEILSGNGNERRIVFRIEETRNIKKTRFQSQSYTCCRFSPLNIDFNDDIGKCFNSFTKSPHLMNVPVPESLLKDSFPMTGTAYYAPYTKKNGIYCVLYAQLDNPHDPNAVKVLRWLPDNKNENNPISHSLYELGFIARDSNKLHNEMCRSGNRFLFGKIEDNMVKIIGNAREFTRYGNLASYSLPYVLFKYVK